MNTSRRSWQVAALVAATLVAGILIGRSIPSEDTPDAGSPFVFTATVRQPSQSQRDRAAARRHVRNAIAAAEAFFADHATCAGMTLADLRRLDDGIEQVQVGFARGTTYCLQSSVGAETASYRGPGGVVRGVACFG